MARRKTQIRQRVKNAGVARSRPADVVTAMHNELRTQILVLLNERVASRPEISRELGISLDKVRYELDVLKKTNPPLIELAFEKPVRGTVEKFYRATKQAYLSPSEWPNVPDAVRPGMRGSLLGILVDDAVAAVTEGTFDALENAHMSWNPMLLDAAGLGRHRLDPLPSDEAMRTGSKRKAPNDCLPMMRRAPRAPSRSWAMRRLTRNAKSAPPTPRVWSVTSKSAKRKGKRAQKKQEEIRKRGARLAPRKRRRKARARAKPPGSRNARAPVSRGA